MIDDDGGWDKDGPEWGLILDAAPILISIHDAGYRIMKVNAALKTLLRKAATEIIGRKCRTL
jgi:PAS domain-containing protein